MAGCGQSTKEDFYFVGAGFVTLAATFAVIPDVPPLSWPGLSRPSTPCFVAKTWMPGTRPGMTSLVSVQVKSCS